MATRIAPFLLWSLLVSLWPGKSRAGLYHRPMDSIRVVGGSGEFDGVETEAVEALSAQAFSLDHGPVAGARELSIEIPRPVSEATAAAD